MILPFVRELLADLEHSPSFEQARRHLALARGRRRVSGLTSTARALYLPLFARAADVPVVIVVADNKAADALQVSLIAGCEMTGAVAPNRVLKLPSHDVLPFENMSPHAEIQEARAATLWKMASGGASGSATCSGSVRAVSICSIQVRRLLDSQRPLAYSSSGWAPISATGTW